MPASRSRLLIVTAGVALCLSMGIGAGAVWAFLNFFQNTGQTIVRINDFPPVSSDAKSSLRENLQDRRLQSWASNLKVKLAQGGIVTSLDESDIEVLLRDTPLSCQNLLDQAKSISRFCKDINITAAIYAAAVRQGDRELAQYPPGAPEAKPILISMNKTKNLLWKIPDSPEHKYINVLLLVYNDCVHWISPTDLELQLDRYHGYAGRVECLFVRNEYDLALSAIDDIDPTAINDDAERGSIAYTTALVLNQMNRYVEEVKFLQIAAHLGAKQETAQRNLVATLCKIGCGTAAKAEYAEYLKRFHPTPSRAQEYRNSVVVALADEEWARTHP